MPDHPAPHPDVAGYVLGALDPGESRDFAAHLRDCDDCRREVAELASLRVMLDRAMPAPVLPPGLAERTFAAIEEAAAAGAPVPARLPEPSRAERARRLRLPAAAVAAVAGVAALVAGLFLMARPGPSPIEVALVADGGGHAVATARLHRGDTGVAVELAVAGLPVPPAGAFYECWYVGAGDTADHPARITAGTFTVAAEGTTTVRMTTAADHKRFPGIEVTLEPDDGDPRSTGPAVLHSVPRT